MDFKIKNLKIRNFRVVVVLLSVVLAIFASGDVRAWGERGHHVVCEVATRLVKEEGLKKYLLSRGHMMGHVCNVPDIWWRSMGAASKSGDAGHYLNPQKLGLKSQDIPLEYSALFGRTFETSDGPKTAEILDLAETLGSLWWRGNQFFELAASNGAAAKSAALPNREESQKDDNPYNLGIYSMTVAMGLLGHFVGDAGQPYHSDADFDGWASGHGGIHGYYESASVDALPLDLSEKVFNAARAERDFKLEPGTSPALQVLREIVLRATPEKSEVERLDPIVRGEKIDTAAAGAGLKVPPKREDASKGAKNFGKLIVKEMGRSAKGLALLWDEIYRRAARPDLSAYKSYRYPLRPDFAEPDYLPKTAAKEGAH